MNRVDEAFAAARSERRGLLIGYLPAGFPSYDGCVEALRAMVDGGVDLVEVGFPYSDPVIDGPTIQRAAERSLAGGTRTRDVLRTVEAVATLVPTVVMTYWNPIERYGVEAFARDLAAAGGSGLITPDLIPDEAEEWTAASDAHGLDRIFLVSPSSTDERIAMTAQACSGFIYATSVMGVTGSRDRTSARAPELVTRVRAASEIPVGVGLGVSNGEQAAEVASYADGVIVGSAFVRRLLDADAGMGAGGSGTAAVAELSRDLAAGVRRGGVHSTTAGTSAGR
ncbi:MAG: tryptophan synthase subunit alpha [Propionibacteriales bacterium]|nr:tryptophan synthase subunit alpha [Propionibacteriales bacterium]